MPIDDFAKAQGYVCLWRKSVASAVFQNDGLWKVWCWCLMRANWKENHVPITTGRGQSIATVKPGQFVFGRKTASEELGMRPSTVQDRMAKLEKMGNIVRQPSTHYTVITVCNWESYQSERLSARQPSRQPSDNQPSTNRQPTDTEKKLNQEKKDKKKEPMQPAVATSPPGFEKFWSAYPGPRRYEGKPQCLKKWKADNLEAKADLILRWLEWNKKHPGWIKDSGEFIPGPHPWLVKGVWLNGEPPDATQPAGKSVADRIAKFRTQHPEVEF